MYKILFVSLILTITLCEQPQFIIFSHDDALTITSAAATSQINVPWTFFISVVQQAGGWTYVEDLIHTDCFINKDSICLNSNEDIQQKYNEGHEMALHSYTHPMVAGGSTPLSAEQVYKEVENNYQYLTDLGVNADDIKGFRAPFLDTQTTSTWNMQTKNDALEHLQIVFNDLNIVYESSFTTGISDDRQPELGVRFCSDKSGGWNLEKCSFDDKDQYSWSQSSGGYPDYTDASKPESYQIYMDAKTGDGTSSGQILTAMDSVQYYCLLNSCSEEIVKNVWLSNFDRHYHGDRTPYGVWLHTQSLTEEVQVNGLKAFIEEVKANYPDAYFVTQSQVLDYEREQVAKSEWNQFFQNRFTAKNPELIRTDLKNSSSLN